MAVVYELVRLRRKNLYLFGHSPGSDWDLLIGAGCVKRVELAYEADEAFGTIGPRWRLAVQRRQIEWEDYSNFAMVARFTAGAMGLPFMPVRSLLGSDVLAMQALSAEARAGDPRTSPLKLKVMESPFKAGDRVVLVPATNTEFAVIHVQRASASGIVHRRSVLCRRATSPVRANGHRHVRRTSLGGISAQGAGAQSDPAFCRSVCVSGSLGCASLCRIQLLRL